MPTRPVCPLVAVVLMSALVTSMAYAAGLSGCYETKSFIARGLDGNFESVATVGNSLVIRQKSEQAFEFDIRLIADFGHNCIARGVATRTSNHRRNEYLFTAEPNGAAKDASCRLRFQHSSKALQVDAVSGDCEAYFSCGARTHLSQLQFLQAKKIPLQEKRCEFPESAP